MKGHIQSGFSTGALYQSVPPTSREAVKIIKELGCQAIEICCVRKKEFLRADLFCLEDLLEGFEYLSIHAPNDIKYGKNEESRAVLSRIQQIHKRLGFKLAVVHAEAIEDWRIFEKFPFQVGIENADWRKSFGKTPEELAGFFRLSDFSLVLDVNHCFTNDSSLNLADDFVSQLGDKISEIHLSGYQTFHDPLYKTGQLQIIEAVPAGVPVIIESICESRDEMEKELRYVKRNL